MKTFRLLQTLVCSTFLLLGLATSPLQGQNAQGTILGHVQDRTGAGVTGADASVRNVNTNVTAHFKTNAVGDYVFVDLIPGTYEVKVDASGFKSSVSSGLILEVDQTLRQNFTLEVGQINEQVTITADAQMVQTDNTTTGTVLDQKAIEELPSSGRDFNNLLGLTAGAGNVTGGSQVDYANRGLNSTFTEVSMNGNRPESVSFMVDGVADTDNFFTSASGVPSEFSIQEFKVQSGLYSAEYGQGAAQINVAIKSGTNQWHGQAYDYLQNDALNPKSPLSEEQYLFEGGAVPKVAPFKQNQFGGTLGGPVKIPWLYNGRNKTFWFFAYDGGRRHYQPSGQSQQAIQVPTVQERTGDFSDWPYPIYDPSTTVCNPTCDATTRTAFAGNQITNIDAMGQKLANLYPLPNINCTMPCNNYLVPIFDSITTNTETFRVDENLGTKDILYFTGTIRGDDEPQPNQLPYTGSVKFTKAQLFGLNWERTISGNTINTARIGYNHLFYAENSITAFGPNLQANLGFANAPGTPALYGLPQISFGSQTSGQYWNIGNGNGGLNTKSGTYQFVDNLKLIRGKHSFTIGADIRRLREFEEDNYLGTGTIAFNGQYTANCNRGATGCSIGGSPAPGLGNPVADLLLSDPSNLSGPYPLGVDYLHTVGTNWNFFVQDDIRVTPRLTVNLGLRYELPPAFHSINNSGWGFSTANGGSIDWVSKSFVQGVEAAAAAQNPPVALNPAFLGCCIQNSLTPLDKKDFAPRIGISWRPFDTDRFVVRAGYGIFYDTYMRYYDQVQNYDDNSLQTTLPSPYPTGTEAGNEPQSLGPRLDQLWSPPIQGLGGTVGSGVFSLPSWDSNDFINIDYILNQVNWPKNHNPYNQQWTLDTQFAVTPTMLLDVGYVGSHGVRLQSYLPFNAAVPPNVPSDNCNYLFDISQATGSNAACATDPNFQPIDTRVPYPGVPSMMYANANVLGSNYNSLQVQLRQRFHRGFTYDVAYTWSKSLDEFSGYNISGNGGFVQDPHNIGGDYGPSSFNQPNRLTAHGSWELPVGKGKRWSLGPGNWVLGGWKASGIYTVTSGRSFSAYGCTVCGFDEMGITFSSRYRPNQSGNPESGFTRSDTEWFNPNVFSLAPQGTYGDAPKGNLRGPYYADLDLSFAKAFAITERQQVQARFEMFNAGSNWHHGAWFPNNNATSSTFGSLVPQQSSADLVSPSTWAHDNLWQGHTIQLSLVYSF